MQVLSEHELEELIAKWQEELPNRPTTSLLEFAKYIATAQAAKE